MCNASEESMDAKGKVTLKFDINNRYYTHTFTVCGSLKQQIIVGRDFLIKIRMTLSWANDKNNKPVKVLKDQFRTIAQAPEPSENNMLRLKRAITVPPRHTVEAEVICGDILAGQHIVVPDSSLMFERPTLKMESMCYDNPEEMEVKLLKVILKNLDSSKYVYLPLKMVIAAAKPEGENEVAHVKITEIKMSTETVEEQYRNVSM